MLRYRFPGNLFLFRLLPGALAALTCLALIGPAMVHAQERTAPDWNNTSDPLQGGIGLQYGQLGGNGLSFRLPLRWWLYFQVAGGVWHTSDDRHHNVGVNLNYILRQDQRLRVFVNGGVGYFYHKEKVGSVSDQDTYELDENWNAGGGVGIEYLQGKRWSWKIEADFAHLGDSGDIKVVPQVGISYYW